MLCNSAKNVLVKLKTFIKEHQLIDNSDQIALAISGGKDSVFAAHLLNELGKSFVLVHCNFNLRGEESDSDEQFVSSLCAKLKNCDGVFIKKFDTSSHAAINQLSIQEAARELRYNYFAELKDQGHFTKLITAHHQSDALETFMINLYRVTGIKGLAGIPKKRDFIIRPFLAFTSNEISDYLASNGISYREDRSNSDLKYLRNKIRLKVLPFIEEHLPSFSKNARASISHLESENELLQYFIKRETNQITHYQSNTDNLTIDKNAIQSFPQPGVILYSILDNYGFNHSQCQQIAESCDADSGKIFLSNTHKVLIDREEIKVEKLKAKNTKPISVSSEGEYLIGNYVVTLKRIKKANFNSNKNEESVEIPENLFPLTLRTWEEGDKFNPLGMKGTKLLSDFFIDEKIDVFSKDTIPLLCKNENVLWVSNYRISESIKVQSNSNLYQITIQHGAEVN